MKTETFVVNLKELEAFECKNKRIRHSKLREQPRRKEPWEQKINKAPDSLGRAAT